MSGQYELVVFPDVESNLVQLITNDEHIRALNTQNPLTVSSSYIGYTNEQTWVHVYRSGGLPQWPLPDIASMHFDVLAPDRATCSLLARTVRAVIHSHMGDTVGNPGTGMKIGNVVDLMGLAWLPDQNELPRYTFAIQISVRPI